MTDSTPDTDGTDAGPTTAVLDCPRCGAALTEDAAACRECGLPFSGAGSVDLAEISAERVVHAEPEGKTEPSPAVSSKLSGTLARKAGIVTPTPPGPTDGTADGTATDAPSDGDDATSTSETLTVTAITTDRALPAGDGTKPKPKPKSKPSSKKKSLKDAVEADGGEDPSSDAKDERSDSDTSDEADALTPSVDRGPKSGGVTGLVVLHVLGVLAVVVAATISYLNPYWRSIDLTVLLVTVVGVVMSLVAMGVLAARASRKR